MPTAPGGGTAESRAQLAATRHVILLKSGASNATVMARVRALGGTIERHHDGIGVLSTRGLSAAAVASLSALADVQGVHADVSVKWLPPAHMKRGPALTVVHAAGDPSTAAFFASQWNLRVIRANNAWKVTAQGRNSLVCILDTGVDPGHIDLHGKVDIGKSTSFVVTEPDIEDHDFHGTFVAALISSNGIGMASVAPKAKLCAIKVLDKTGTGDFTDLITGIVYAADVGAGTINMSLGAVFDKNEPGLNDLITALQRAINYAQQHGVLAVAAAGNDGIDFSHTKGLIALPAGLQNVISVGATAPIDQTNFDRIPSYSNEGFPAVDVFAPGGDFINGVSVPNDLILSACSRYTTAFDCKDGKSYLIGSGTSFAAPHVSGEAAVIDSDKKIPDPPSTVQACILKGADAITGVRPDPIYGYGRIDVLGGKDCRRII